MHDIIVSSRSEPPRPTSFLSVCCLIVERRADGVPGAKHGGIAAFVIQLLEGYCNAAACCQLWTAHFLKTQLVRDYSAYNFDS